MWQGVQDQFVDKNGQPCQARVTIASGDQATCFVGANGKLRCAGALYTTTFGSSFMDTGVSGVEQILMSPTFNSADHQSICVVRTGIGGQCWGGNNDQGQFGDGDKLAAASPAAWGNLPDVRRIATGTWDQICALTGGGDVYCAGYSYGVTPMAGAAGVHKSLFVDTFGAVTLDSSTVFRVPNSRAECKITVNGYDCNTATPFGTAGNVVDGTIQQAMTAKRACWLDSAGKVRCALLSSPPPPPVPVFTALPVLAISGNYYSDAICAVYNDGSIACMGNNAHGELGTGNMTYVAAETIVAPAGTIDVICK